MLYTNYDTVLSDSRNVHYMRRCLQLAMGGRHGARPNPMVGAVIVASTPEGERIIGEGFHQCCGKAHAEVNAFASVSAADESLLPTSTLYVSLEPCAHWGKTPPCAELIIRKGIHHVVVGCTDSFDKVSGRGIQMLTEAGIHVETGILEAQCRWLNRRFFTFHEKHRPYIILKWAQSADGYIDDHYKPYHFSNTLTQHLFHRLRAEEDAIVVGHTTLLRDNPQLTTRHWYGANPSRFILGNGTTIETLIERCVADNLQSLIVEGGAKTHQTFLDANLWDEIRIETAPVYVNEGTKVATLPPDAIQVASTMVAGNSMALWVPRQTPYLAFHKDCRHPGGQTERTDWCHTATTV